MDSDYWTLKEIKQEQQEIVIIEQPRTITKQYKPSPTEQRTMHFDPKYLNNKETEERPIIYDLIEAISEPINKEDHKKTSLKDYQCDEFFDSELICEIGLKLGKETEPRN